MVGAVVLVLSACGSGSEGAGTDNAVAADAGQADDADSSEDRDDANEPAAQPVAEGESPIADLLGIPLNDDDAMQEYFGQLQRDAELKISECMIAQGFEYRAVDYSQIDALDTALDEDSEEFAETYGFGISANPTDRFIQAFEDFNDPNEEYVTSLGAGELEAYQQALRGELPDGASDDDFTFEPAGCAGEAYAEAFKFGSVFEQFAGEIEAAEEAFDADPRIVAATAGWTQCMADGGYSYADVEGARSDFQRRYDALVNVPGAYQEVDVPDGEDSELGDGPIFGPRTLVPDVQEQVDALADEERAVALAAWTCNEPLREIEDDVQIEYEQQFVDEHGSAIRTILDS